MRAPVLPTRRVIVALLLLLLVVTAVTASAQSGGYELVWFAVNGGGGSSGSSHYTLGGVAGQVGAGITMSGGEYTLVGGFWSAEASPWRLHLPLISK